MKINLLRDSKPVWKAAIEWDAATKKQQEDANLRNIRDNEAVLDCDSHGAQPCSFAGTIARLHDDGMKFEGYQHRGGGEDSGHIHLYFDRDVTNAERAAIVAHYGADAAKGSASTFIAYEGRPHFKTGQIKRLVAADFKGINAVPGWAETAPKKEPVSVKDIAKPTAEGSRNENAFRLATFHRKAQATQEEAGVLLAGWNQGNTPPLPDSELNSVIASAYRGDAPYSVYFKENPLSSQTSHSHEEEKGKEWQFETMTGKAMAEMPIVPIKYVIEPFISEKSTNFIFGRTGTGKTWVTLDAAISVAVGREFFDAFKVKQGKALVINEEDNEQLIQSRLNAIKELHGLKDEDLENIDFAVMSGAKFDVAEKLEKIEEKIKERGYSLIVVDSFRRIFNGEENDAGVISDIFDTFKTLSKKYNCSFLCVHHDKKGSAGEHELDMARGSSDIINVAHSIIRITKTGNRERFIFEHMKSKNVPELAKFYFQLRKGDRLMLEHQGQVPEKANKGEDAKRQIMEYLAKMGVEVGRIDLIRAFPEMKERTIERTLEELKEDQQIMPGKKTGKYAIYSQKGLVRQTLKGEVGEVGREDNDNQEEGEL